MKIDVAAGWDPCLGLVSHTNHQKQRHARRESYQETEEEVMTHE